MLPVQALERNTSLAEHLGHRFDKVEAKLDTLVVDVAQLKVKASYWGLLAGLIPVILSLAYILLERI